MHTGSRKQHLPILLALLLLANSLVTLTAMGAVHSLAADEHSHAVHHHHDDHADFHHVTAIESGPDEHGCQFHVHLPAHALVAAFSAFEYEAVAAVVPAPSSPLPLALAYAPPVPPPNA